MQQRQLRLGDILDDYCPRERRVTNHAVVAMIGADVKQTRCTTCDAEHEYKHAKVPRQRRKVDTPAALYSQVLASGPKRVAHEEMENNGHNHAAAPEAPAIPEGTDDALDIQDDVDVADEHVEANSDAGAPNGTEAVDAAPQVEAIDRESESAEPDDSGEPGEPVEEGEEGHEGEEDGPVHRPLIRASLPRPEGQPPPTRPIPEFTIRQPGGRPNRFRPRHQRGGQQQQFGNRSNGNMSGGPSRGGGGMRQGGGGRPPQGNMPRAARHHGPPGRKRSK
jgi:hypothetical protein